MFKLAIVVFRECLEISLLLGVILAITKPIANSRIYIILGACAGVVLAAIFALFTRRIAANFGEVGDEIFGSFVILLTAVIINWTVVWMQGYSAKIRKNLSTLSENIVAGLTSKLILVSVVATTILREGAEIILFIYSITSAGTLTSTQYLIGLGVGALSGVIVGTIMYLGLLKYSGRYIFKISTILLTLVAAGLAAEAAGILTSCGVIHAYSQELWNTAWLIDNKSIVGKLLKLTIGYDARPNALQVIFYVGSITMTLIMMKIKSMLAKNSHFR